MARNHASCKKGLVSSQDLSLKCSEAIDLGAELYKKITQLKDTASGVYGYESIELEDAVTEQGSVLIHLANEITDGDDLEHVRAELAKRQLEDII